MLRFDRFTSRSQDVAANAYGILQHYGHSQVDTEHILLALLEQSNGLIPSVLEKMSVDIEPVKKRVEDVLKATPKVALYGGGTGQVFITPRVKRVIDLANEEANRLKHTYVSTGHIFLAILREKNTAVARILSEAKILREKVEELVKDEPEEEQVNLKDIRVSLTLSLDMLLQIADQLSLDDARELYKRLGKKLGVA